MLVRNTRRRRFSPSEGEGPSWPRKIASGAANFLSAVFISDSSSDSDSDSEQYISDHNALLNHSDERKNAIKQLLLQETFSREECDMLVKIIHSRVDSAHIPGNRISIATPEHAVMEAKKFLEEKKAGRSPQSEFGHGSTGSPANMAKSYMQSRPPWASPSYVNFERRTLHNDSVTPFKERSYRTCGAWDMQDEIRRLRSKASEDMVSPLSSSKVDLSLLSPLPRSSHDNGVTNVNLLGADSNKDIPASDIREGTIIEASLDSERKQDMKSSQIDYELAVSDHSLNPACADIREGAVIEAALDSERKQDMKASQIDYEPAVSDHSLNPVRAGSKVSSRNDTVNVECLSQNSLEELSQGQSQEQSETEGKKKSNNMGPKQQEKKPVRRQPKRQKKG